MTEEEHEVAQWKEIAKVSCAKRFLTASVHSAASKRRFLLLHDDSAPIVMLIAQGQQKHPLCLGFVCL